jgi:hypothetical protein
MPSLTRRNHYGFHTANLRAVGDGLHQLARVGKDALRRNDEAAILTVTRLYALALAAEAETRLLKVLYEPPVSQQDRDRVLQAANQEGKWLTAIDFGFRRSYSVGEPRPLEPNLAFTARARRAVLRETVSEDLAGLIQVRNGLAHGQWAYAFNTDLTELSQPLMRELKTENLRALEHKRAIVSALALAVQDLLVSPPTFERDFDSHFEVVERRRRQLDRTDFAGYVSFLRRRHDRRSQYLSTQQ